MLKSNIILPIVYRCDIKYRFFLVNSIVSVLKYYRGKKTLHFYICTNDELDLTCLDQYKNKYTFDYTILKIDSSFFKQHQNLKNKEHLAVKRYFSFNFDDIESNHYNNETYQFNPFRRNKFIIASTLFFLGITDYEKVISLDTDTLVVADIDELYNMDVSDAICSSCTDWGSTGVKFNPSVSVVNIEQYKRAFYAPDGVLARLDALNNTKLLDTMPYCEVVQKILNDVFKDKIKLIDSEWNVPITHMHEYPKPKIYHFSESWTGNKTVLTTYNSILDKYIGDEQYKHPEF